MSYKRHKVSSDVHDSLSPSLSLLPPPLLLRASVPLWLKKNGTLVIDQRAVWVGFSWGEVGGLEARTGASSGTDHVADRLQNAALQFQAECGAIRDRLEGCHDTVVA